MEQAADKLALVEKLIQCIAQESDQGIENEKKVTALMEYAIRILSSRLTPPPLATDEYHISQLLQKKISQELGPSEAHRFAKLFDQLESKSTLSSNWPILYLLYSLTRLGDLAKDTPAFHTRALEYRPENTFKRKDNTERQDRSTGGDTSKSAFPGSLPEQRMLARDCLYAFQGLVPSQVVFDHAAESYVISTEGTSPSVRQILSRTCEIGWHCKSILSLLHATKSKEASPGLVLQAFVSSVQAELSEYYRLVALLEGQLHAHNTSISQDQQRHLGSAALTLRRLTVWVQGPLERLRTLHHLVGGCLSQSNETPRLHGGQVASHIYSFLHHGDPQRRELVSNILSKTAVPIADSIREWVYRGILQDPWHEFFIEERAGVPSHQTWSHKYQLRSAMIPAFIPLHLAKKILHIGKAINFLRQCAGDDDVSLPAQDISFSFAPGESSMEDSISKVADTVNAQVLHLLFERHKFRQHCDAIRRYLLLGQGDFVLCLMRLLGSDLDAPAHTVFRHNLTGAVERALAASNAQFDDADILRRLDIRLLPNDNEGEGSGWDIFSLDYSVDVPINSIFTPKAMNKYIRLFNFLWLIRRAQQSLSAAWKHRMTSRRKREPRSGHEQKILQSFHKWDLLRSHMVHFVSNLQHYISFEVLTPSWQAFMQALESAVGLDEVIAAHKTFLRVMTVKAFLQGAVKKGRTSTMLGVLRKLFSQILRFRTAQDGLAALMHADSSQSEEFENVELAMATEQLEETARAYEETFKLFRGMLSQGSSSTQHPLFFLAFRLDFSGFFARKAEQEKEALLEKRIKQRADTGQ